ncbi:IPT/TIG domain-containing protein [Streptomyces sp. NPDC002181]|uniref:IPT/TIG domain-containing protein n=1 Tax=Streptomyces sp. NPDC002181 TaxID=3364635 RepID=UPI0036AB3B43
MAVKTNAGRMSGGTQVTLNGSGLPPAPGWLFGTLGPDGCFTGRQAVDVVVLSDSALVATTPEWPQAETVSVYAATACAGSRAR